MFKSMPAVRDIVAYYQARGRGREMNFSADDVASIIHMAKVEALRDAEKPPKLRGVSPTLDAWVCELEADPDPNDPALRQM